MKEIKILIAKRRNKQIREVFDKTWLATYPNKKYGITVDDIKDHIEKRHKKIKKSKKDNIKNSPKEQILLIAKEGTKVVGACRIILKEDRNQLQAIYVLPEYQGKGIGTMFWHEVQKYADPIKDFYVELAVYNKNALNFYKKLGFIDTKRRIKNERLRMKSGNIIPEMEMIFKK